MSAPAKHFSNRDLGIRGEQYASKLLEQKGYTILERNFRKRYGEIDIIARDGDTIVFVEVKTRTSDAFGMPEEAITKKKLQEIIKTAEYFLQIHPDAPRSMRIDVIGLMIDRLGTVQYQNHLQSVTS